MGVTTYPPAKVFDIGTWNAYVPTVLQSVAITTSVNACRFSQVGQTVTARGQLTLSSSGTSGQPLAVGLPVPPLDSVSSVQPIGTGYVLCSTGQVPVICVLAGGTTMSFIRADAVLTNYFGADPSIQLVSGNQVNFSITYDALTPLPMTGLLPAVMRYQCLSTARPTVGLYTGFEIQELDTGRIMRWNGFNWTGTAVFLATHLATSGGSGVSADTVINSLVFPDMGCAGVIDVFGIARADQSVAGDVFQVRFTTAGTNSNYEHGPVSPSGGLWIHQVRAFIAQAAGSSTTLNLTLNRDGGSGTATYYAATAAPNAIQALFVPNN